MPEQRTELLFAHMSNVDHYVRDTCSTAMVKALLDLPVDIYSRGWDHVRERRRGRAFTPRSTRMA